MSVGRFDSRGGAVAERFVQTLGVPSVDPAHGGDLDRLGGLPDSLGVDQLGLEQAVDGLGQGVVVGVSEGADRCGDPGGDQRVEVRQKNVLGSSIAVMDQSALAAHDATGQQCVLQRQQGQAVDVENRSDRRSDDLASAYVGDDGDAAESGEDPHVGDVSDPQAVRLLCSKAPLDRIRADIGHVSGVFMVTGFRPRRTA